MLSDTAPGSSVYTPYFTVFGTAVNSSVFTGICVYILEPHTNNSTDASNDPDFWLEEEYQDSVYELVRTPTCHKRLIPILDFIDHDVITAMCSGNFNKSSPTSTYFCVVSVCGRAYMLKISDIVRDLHSGSSQGSAVGSSTISSATTISTAEYWTCSPIDQNIVSIKSRRTISPDGTEYDMLITTHSDQTVSVLEFIPNTEIKGKSQGRFKVVSKWQIHDFVPGYITWRGIFDQKHTNTPDKCSLIVSGPRCNFAILSEKSEKPIHVNCKENQSPHEYSSSRLCKLSEDLFVLVEFTGQVWKMSHSGEKTERQLEPFFKYQQEVFDVDKFVYDQRLYLLAVSCGGSISIAEIGSVPTLENGQSSRVELYGDSIALYLFDLGMHVRASILGKFFFTVDHNETDGCKPWANVQENILIIITFEGRILIFDLDTCLQDKISLQKINYDRS